MNWQWIDIIHNPYREIMKSSILVLFLMGGSLLDSIESFGGMKSLVRQQLNTRINKIRGITSIRTQTQTKGRSGGNELTVIPPPVENRPLAFLHFIKADILFIKLLKFVENFFIGMMNWLGEDEDEEEYITNEKDGSTVVTGRAVGISKKQQELKSRIHDGNSK